jgi:hypothetical protein
MGDTRNENKIFVGKPEGKRPLVRWKNNRVDLKEAGEECVELLSSGSGQGTMPDSCE